MPNRVSDPSHSWRRSHSFPQGRCNAPPLPPAIQEHLGRMLRADYYERDEKPRYLGDPGLPPEFTPYLVRLAQKERILKGAKIREQGTRAVANALSGLAF